MKEYRLSANEQPEFFFKNQRLYCILNGFKLNPFTSKVYPFGAYTGSVPDSQKHVKSRYWYNYSHKFVEFPLASELASQESASELACHESASELASKSASGNRLLNWPLNRPQASLSASFSPEKNQASLSASCQ